ncbi:MAG: hypothetical protein J6X55_09520 [Victivallales bacterium]|nr:hypothetical protein [Victivallales bacterium]
MKPTLLVLAAGMGSRFGGDKQISEVGPKGEYILDFSMYDAWRAGFGSAVLIIRKELEAPLKEHFGTRWEGKLDISFVEQRLTDLPEGFECPAERKKPWGTGHAIWCARNAVKGPFAAINADDYYGVETFKLLGDYFRKSTADSYSMVGFELLKTLSENGSVSRGICKCSDDGRLLGVIEHTGIVTGENGGITGVNEETKQTVPLTGKEVASMNFWGFPVSIFKELDVQLREFLSLRGKELKSEFYIPSVVDRLIHEKNTRVDVLSSPEKWFGMTYLADRPVVVARFKELTDAGVYPA